MRRPRSQSFADFDAVDVLLVEDGDEDVAADEVGTVLHELALEAMARRSTWIGDPRSEIAREDMLAAPVPVSPPVSLAVRVTRRYRRRAVACVVLALAVAVTTAVVDARQTAARAAAFAAIPAVLTEAPHPPAEVWRVPGRVVSDRADRLLVADGASLQSIDPATGAVTWTASAAASRAASTGDCFGVDDEPGPARAPVDDGAGPRDLVACVADAARGTSAAGHTTPDARAVVVLDATTGRTRHTVAVDGALLLAEPVGQDLLVAAARADGRVRITRWDLATGTPRWNTVSPRPVLTGSAEEAVDAVERRPDSLTVGAFAVDLSTGAELDADRESAQPYPYEEHTLPGGARVTWAWLADGTAGRGRVSGGDAERSYRLPGPPVRPSVTDGSDAGVLVVRTAHGDRLRGLDLRTGQMRWTQPWPGASALRATALVDGVMLLDDGATVTALDVRTGEDIWRTPVDPGAADGAALTDGEVVLLPVRAGDGSLELVAHRIADGTVAWRTPAPPGTVTTTVVDHHLVASTDAEVIGLG